MSQKADDPLTPIKHPELIDRTIRVAGGRAAGGQGAYCKLCKDGPYRLPAFWERHLKERHPEVLKEAST